MSYQNYLAFMRFGSFFLVSSTPYMLLYLTVAVAMGFPFDSHLAEITPFYMAVTDNDSHV